MATETHGEALAEEIAGTCIDTHGGAIGMPQLCFDWYPNQIFWLVVTLVVIFLVLSKVALPRIASVLAERQGTITNDIAAAEELKVKASEAEAAYERALADARSEAQKIAGEAKAEMQAEVQKAIDKADAEIAARTAEGEARIDEIRKGASAAIREVARDTAKEVVAAMGVDVDAKAVEAAVTARTKG